MSDTTVDYSDSKIDAGGDNTYDSSQYGTTTGVNDAPKHKNTAQDHEPQHTQKDKGQLHEQAQNYGSQEQDDDMTTAESRTAQGYTKSGPNIGA